MKVIDFRTLHHFLEIKYNENHLKKKRTRSQRRSPACRRVRRRTRRQLKGWASWGGSGVHGPGTRSRARWGGRGTAATTGAGPAASSRAGLPWAASYGRRMARRGRDLAERVHRSSRKAGTRFSWTESGRRRQLDGGPEVEDDDGHGTSKSGRMRGSPALGTSQMGAPSSVEDVCGRNREEIDHGRRRSLRTRRRSFGRSWRRRPKYARLAANQGKEWVREAQWTPCAPFPGRS